nr:hypothetical protein [Tanacetum cinerariifolium]
MEDTMFDLVKICHHKQFLCIHDDIDNLIESALNSKLLSINSINSQRLDKKEQEVKNVVELPAERGNRSIQSLQNFRVVHKSSIFFDKSQISSIHSIAPIQSTKEPVHSLEDEIECDMPAKDVCSPFFTTFSNPLFKDNDNFDSSDDESLSDEDIPAEEFKIYSNPLCDEDEINSDKLDPHCFNVESYFVESLLNRDTFIDFSSKFDFSGELELNAEIADTIIESIPLPISVQDGNSQQEEIDIVTETDDVLPPSDENDDDLSNASLLEEADLSLCLIIRYHWDNPSISRPPPEPPDDNFDLEPEVISAVMEDIDEPDEHFNPGGEILFLQTMKMLITFLSCLSFKFSYHISSFLRFLLYYSPLRVRTRSLILDYLPEIEVILCRIYVRFPRSSYPLIDFSLGSLLKGRGFPGHNKTPGPWSARIPMWQLFKRLG